MMNKKIVAGTFLTAIVAASIVTWFFYIQIGDLNSQNSDLQQQINELEDRNRKLKDQISELQDQNSHLRDQVIELENTINMDNAREVKITDFEWIGGYHHLGQVNLLQNFKVTIENMGDKTVSGLTLSVELLSVGTEAKISEYHKQINITRAGQIVEISGIVSVGQIDRYAHTAVGVITLTLGDVLLDQWTRNLEGSF